MIEGCDAALQLDADKADILALVQASTLSHACVTFTLTSTPLPGCISKYVFAARSQFARARNVYSLMSPWILCMDSAARL